MKIQKEKSQRILRLEKTTVWVTIFSHHVDSQMISQMITENLVHGTGLAH